MGTLKNRSRGMPLASADDTGPETSKRRRPALFSHRGILILLIVFLVRGIWSSVTLSSHWYDAGVIEYEPTVKNRPLTLRRPKRARQSRPPPLTLTGELGSPWFGTPTLNQETVIPGGRSLCGEKGHGPLDSSSRVLISGIFLHPLGSELAMALAKHCGVQSIVGISDEHIGGDSTLELAFLLRHLPDFEIRFEKMPFNATKVSDLVLSFEPTHVVHFEPTSAGLPNWLQTIPAHATLQSSLQNLNYLCNSIVQQRIDGLGEPRFLYVLVGEPEPQLWRHAMIKVTPMILRTYQLRFGLQVAQLKLPFLYGPYRSGVELFERSGSATGPLMHIADAVEATIRSLSTRAKSQSSLDTLAVFNPGQDKLVAGDQFAGFFNNTDKALKAMADDKVSSMVSYYHKNRFPYKDVSSVYEPEMKNLLHNAIDSTNSRLHSNQLETVSLLQRRQHNLFPCESECASHVSCRKTSALTPLLPITRNLTDDCRYVIYVVDFSKQLAVLPLVRESFPGNENAAWPRDTVCQVALVSGKSKLVRGMVDQEKKANPSRDLHSSDLNGKLSHNGWRLAWLKHDDSDSLSEADYIMPKLLPASFFSYNTSKAIYVEPEHLMALPSLPIFWHLLSKTLDAKRIPAGERSIKKGHVNMKQMMPATPARHVGLFAHMHNVSMVVMRERGIDFLAKFVLMQKKREIERAWPRRQLQVYGHMLRHFDFTLPDTVVLAHNIRSKRSRRFRCDWYEEQVFWSDQEFRNRDMEELSMAAVMARWRSEGLLKGYDGTWGERIVDAALGDQTLESNAAQSQHFMRIVETPMKTRKFYGTEADG